MALMTQEPVTPYKMNLPTALKERIEAEAKANRRSISGEIIAALEEKYPEPVPPQVDSALAMALKVKAIAAILETSDPGSDLYKRAKDDLKEVLAHPLPRD